VIFDLTNDNQLFKIRFQARRVKRARERGEKDKTERPNIMERPILDRESGIRHDELLSTVQAARICDVSRQYILQCINEKSLPAQKIAGRYLINSAVLARWNHARNS